MTTTSAAAPATDTLVAGAKARDEQAWHRIVTEYGPKIRGYARARGAPDPDDLTQDVFAAAAARIDDFVGDDAALRSWLFGIAYRQIVDRYRAKAKQAAPLPATLTDTAPTPEGEAVAAAETAEAVAALDVLTDLERDVVLMRVVGEMPSRDVAAAVGKQPGNVRVIQSRALEKLRRELDRRGFAGTAAWTAALTAGMIVPLGGAQAAALVGAAAAAAGTAATAAAGVAVATTGVSAATKTAVAVALVAAVGGGAAVTDSLPDPAQRWIAEVGDRVGISLPRPAATPAETPPPTVPAPATAPTTPGPPDLPVDLPIQEHRIPAPPAVVSDPNTDPFRPPRGRADSPGLGPPEITVPDLDRPPSGPPVDPPAAP